MSVAVTEDSITVIPTKIATAAEPTQQIPQNAHAKQPTVRSTAPLDVNLVAANLTDREAHLVVKGTRKRAVSKPLVPHGAVTLQTSLPSGVYTVSAVGIPGAKPTKLTVGKYRSSSENDLLLP